MAFYDNPTITLAIRAVQGLFAIIVLGTAGYVVSWYRSNFYASSAPSSIAFLVFVAVWTLLVLIYFVLVGMMFRDSAIGHPYAVTGLEALTMLFWFAGFIAVAAITDCGSGRNRVCNSAAAASAFGAFEWVLFVITLTFAVMGVLGRRRGSSNKPVASSGGGVTTV